MKAMKFLIMIGMIALLAACSDPRPAAEVVQERAQARWEAMVARDFQTAWEYYTPGYREQMTAGEFEAEMARRPVRWTAAEVFEVSCADEEPGCVVRARVNYEAQAAVPGVGMLKSMSGVTETWLQIDGKWWYSADA
jgi:hypothetical protein